MQKTTNYKMKSLSELVELKNSLLAKRTNLLNKIKSLKQEAHGVSVEANKVSKFIEKKRGEKYSKDGKVNVSEHALVRYLERHVGIDIKKYRSELGEKAENLISNRVNLKELENNTFKIVTPDGIEFFIRNGTLTTTWCKQEPEPTDK